MGAAQRRKITTAWHEAGHIVVGLHFNFKLMRASIIPIEGSDGLSYGRTEWESLGTGKAAPLLHHALAGRVVEERLYGTKGYRGDRDDQAIIQTLAWASRVSKRGYTPHIEVIPRLAAVYRNPDRVPVEVKRIADEMVKQAMPVTVRLVNEHWSEIEAVAALLLKHGIVTPELLAQPSVE